MRHFGLPVLASAILILSAACDDEASSGGFKKTDCPMPIPEGQNAANIRCGTITLPEDPTQEDGATVTLAVAVLEATGNDPKAEPLLVVNGGPGIPTLAGAMQAFTSEFAEPLQTSRDIVFVDQRGTGYSLPSLDCPEQRESYRKALAGEGDVYAGLAACGERLAGQGVNLSHYNSSTIARDLSATMKTLGYDEWDVYGWSYGTRIALTMLRDAPDGVRSVVLDATVPPQADGQSAVSQTFGGALGALAEDCGADAACVATYPDFEPDTLRLAREKLNETPLVVQIDDPLEETTLVTINGGWFRQAIIGAMYDVRLIPSVPGAINAVAQGRTSAARDLVSATAFDFDSTADGMFFSVLCNEDIPFDTGDEVGLQLCQDLGVRVTPELIEDKAVSSDVPVLLLGGEYDPVAPLSDAELALETLSHGMLVKFPYEGHGVFLTLQAMDGETPASHACSVGIIAAFLDDVAATPDTGCVDDGPPPGFVVE
ncbi:MAG: alpha/beta fold hydrolase [Chloroflexi bacterium]|nr:alpha/beta fold hydrolase [Chloroflexota bacterium]